MEAVVWIVRRQRITIPSYDLIHRFLRQFYGPSCAQCGATGKLEIDHVLPWSLGGKHELENFQLLCPPDNAKKNATHRDYRPAGWRERLEALRANGPIPVADLPIPESVLLENLLKRSREAERDRAEDDDWARLMSIQQEMTRLAAENDHLRQRSWWQRLRNR